MKQWEIDLNRSVEAFNNVVWPQVKQWFANATVRQIENSKTKDSLLLDMLTGIDLWQISTMGVKGIASRVQFNSNYKSFTIRYRRSSGSLTEFIKRTEALYSNSGNILPFYTMQAYVYEPDIFLSGAIIETKDLFDYISSNAHDIDTRENRQDDNIFKVAYWDKIKQSKNNLSLKIIEKKSLLDAAIEKGLSGHPNFTLQDAIEWINAKKYKNVIENL